MQKLILRFVSLWMRLNMGIYFYRKCSAGMFGRLQEFLIY